ncbi:MAG: Na/Pi symporter [Cytophagales bacterium]|jgi:phosphate:Na+ symporter|nr:Na/Pi symporter [Cytophagales bacterium]
MWDIILPIVGGLFLFLYAVLTLSDTIQKAMGERAKQWILTFTSNLFLSIVTGTVVTTLLDSSSAVIIIAIIFVNAGLLTFRQAIGIVLGANIGTTVSSQIIAMDVAKYSPVLLLVGFFLMVLSKSEKVNTTGRVILLFGVLFFGLFTMENAVEPLKENPVFFEYLKKTENPIFGAVAGAVITLVIQSSSATVGMAVILAKKGFLSLAGGIAVMFGAELGTCSDTLMATIKGSRQAIKTGIFHLTFNLFSILIGLALFQPFVSLVSFIGRNVSVERSLANAHMLFNITGVLVFVWFVPVFERILNKLLPEINEPQPKQQVMSTWS